MAPKLDKLIAANAALKGEIADRIQELERSRAIARISDENPNPVMRVTGTGDVIYVNGPAAELMAEWQIDVGDRLPVEWRRHVERATREGEMAEYEFECAGRVFMLTLQPVAENEYVNIFGRDVTRRKEAEEQIVNYDDLTGLPNRALFQDRLKQVLSHARRTGKLCAVHIVDLDRFKEVNETMGHDAGDMLLKAVAERIAGCIRTSDTVARLGGDEFGIIQVEPNDDDGVAILAQKLLDSLSPPVEIDGRAVHTNASIGITLFPVDAMSPEEALRNADLALSHGKDGGRGTYRFFVAKMHEDMQRRRAIEDDMRVGLEKGEFVLHYQPKLHLGSGRITGMEALVRWEHPEQGFMSPAEFIPIAERSKLILPLSEWVLHEACSANKRWTDAGLGPVKVAVNVSAVQIRETRLPEVIRRVLDATGLAPNQLELEITESLAMQDAESTTALFNELRAEGISISIDDFGTGYSSLSRLRDFPVQRIKIDKSFVDDIDGTDKSGAIARAVTTMGHSFDMEITAEGVESEDQLNFLAAIGCDEVQGYFFSKPLAADAFTAFIREHGADGSAAVA